MSSDIPSLCSCHVSGVPCAPVTGATSGTAAYERLRHAIMRLELAPGAAVSEAQLVEAFGFSKAAVRPALARLRGEGLVVAEPCRGPVVASLTMRDVLEIYDLRLQLEPPADRGGRRPDGARRPGAAARRSPTRRWTSATPSRSSGSCPPTATIHLAHRRGRRRRRPARILERLLDDSERARLVALRAGAASGGVRARQELQRVLTALEAGDGPRAARLMSEAIRTFRDELVESLQRAALDMPLTGLPAGARER